MYTEAEFIPYGAYDMEPAIDVADESSTRVHATNPHSGSTCQRRRVVGVDVRAERPVEGAVGDQEVVSKARIAAANTHLRLVAAVDARPDGSAVRDSDLLLRFVARRDDVHVTDDAIWELLAALSKPFRWSQLVKLEEFDGMASFDALPSP